MSAVRLGLGVGWRPELAHAIAGRDDLGFVEVIAENVEDPRHPPRVLMELKDRGIRIVPHGISLSLGGAELPDPRRLDHLARLAEAVDAPLVSEHIAFVRAGGREAGHLLPVPRTEEMLEILAENVAAARRALPVPLALENIAALSVWEEDRIPEGEFLRRVAAECGVPLLLDLSNVYTNVFNFGGNEAELIAEVPADSIAYAHIGGGIERDGLWHDTHGHPVPQAVYTLLEEVAARIDLPGVMLERDENFTGPDEFHGEVDAIAAAWARGRSRRQAP